MFWQADRDDNSNNYASDSSIGLYATDNEGASSGNESSSREVIYPLQQYESGNDSGEISRLEIVNENQPINVSNDDIDNQNNQNQHQQNHGHGYNNNDHNHQLICNKCPLHERKIYELRTMLMEQRRDDAMTIKQLKKKYNRLIEKYVDKKKLLKKLSIQHFKHTQRIENIEEEMKRLSDNNQILLKEKHDVERAKDELKSTNLDLQHTLNSQKQSVHSLTINNVCTITITIRTQ